MQVFSGEQKSAGVKLVSVTRAALADPNFLLHLIQDLILLAFATHTELGTRDDCCQ